MELGLMLLIGCGILLLLTLTVSGFILYRVSEKKRIRVNILLKAKRWKVRKIKIPKIKDKLQSEGYVFDEKALIKGFNIDNIYYYEDNPNPIIFDAKKSVVGTYTSKDLKNILDSDLIDKLFNEKRQARMELLLFIILGITGLMLLGVIGLYLKKPDIVSEGNRLFLTDIIRTILAGG